MPARKAEAQWEGNLLEGKGKIKFGSYEAPYSFASRFEDGNGTNPEELIAAAHAGCFTMAFSSHLAKAGHTATKVHTTATVHIQKVGDGFEITKIDLVCEAQVPGIENAEFQDLAKGAKIGCPVSRALAAVSEITLDAKLV